MPGRPLSERVTLPPGRDRSRSPNRDLEDEAARKNIDRYVPGGHRSRSPIRNRRRDGGGRRPGAHSARGGNNTREGGERKTNGARPRKTQDELDAEMEDYFNGNQPSTSGGGQTEADQVGDDDIDMIE